MFEHEDNTTERRKDSLGKGDAISLFQRHSDNCPTNAALRELQREVQELWKKVIMFEVLDHRVTAIEDTLTTIEASISKTMQDIHKIQTSIAESNIVHLWAGRIIIAILSAGMTFLTAKYT